MGLIPDKHYFVQHLQKFKHWSKQWGTFNDLRTIIDSVRLMISYCILIKIKGWHIFFLNYYTQDKINLSDYGRDIMASRYPTTLVDMSALEVKQTLPYNEHDYW